MIVTELMQSSKVATVAQRESISIGNIVLDANRLFSSILPQFGVCDAHYVVTLIASAPRQPDRQCLCPLIVACHADFIQRCDVEGSLWETVRRHETLMTAL